jgi:HK97 family phage major capsid protein
MSNEMNKRYREELMGLSHRMNEILEATEKAGEWTAEERTNFDAASTRADELEAKVKQIEDDSLRAARASSLAEVDYSSVVQTRTGGGVETPEQSVEERDAAHDAEYLRAFESYARHGERDLRPEQRALLASNYVRGGQEQRAGAITSPGSSGGYLIPPGYRQIIIERMKAFGGLLQYATVINTSTGNSLQWPTNDDTANMGAINAETHDLATGDTAFTFGTATLGAWLYASGVALVSVQLLQDSVFDLNTWLPDHVGTRIGRKVAAVLVTGAGTTEPLGVATNATAAVTGADQTSITYDNLIDLEHSLDPAYRNNCRFMMNDATLAVIRKIKDSQGHPLWVPVPVPGMAPTINGQPYFVDQGMAAPGASAKSILFGDFARAYVVRQVLDMNMVRFDERFMSALQVGFLGFTRLDATVQDSNAYAAFQHHA